MTLNYSENDDKERWEKARKGAAEILNLPVEEVGNYMVIVYHDGEVKADTDLDDKQTIIDFMTQFLEKLSGQTVMLFSGL